MKAFYVDIIRAEKIGLLAGPFPSEEVARKYERAATAKAMDVDPWAAFDSFGVVSLDAPDYRPAGRINHLIEIDPADLLPVIAKEAA